MVLARMGGVKMALNPVYLSDLSQQIISYAKLPEPLPQEVQENVKKALIVSGISIPALFMLPVMIEALANGSFYKPFNFIYWPAQIMWTTSEILQGLSIACIPAIIISFVGLLVMLKISAGMTLPVTENVHKASLAAMFPAGISAVVLAIAILVTLVATILAVIIWIVPIAFCVAVIIFILAAL